MPAGRIMRRWPSSSSNPIRSKSCRNGGSASAPSPPETSPADSGAVQPAGSTARPSWPSTTAHAATTPSSVPGRSEVTLPFFGSAHRTPSDV